MKETKVRLKEWQDQASWIVGARDIPNATYTLTSSPVGATSYTASNVVAANAR